MTFVHIADVHFDTPFLFLDAKADLGVRRRIEQREAFKRTIDFVKNHEIDYLFISGDLFDQQYVRLTTIEYINDCFLKIPNTKIYVSPGNHDPFVKNSPYNTYNWASNVHIFVSDIGKYEEDDVDVYGYGFDNPYVENSEIGNIKIEDKNKINILVTHGAIDSSLLEDRNYNPIKRKDLLNLGFEYIAMGHIHKKDYEGKHICYPGSLVSLGFDEPGEHGMLVRRDNKTGD